MFASPSGCAGSIPKTEASFIAIVHPIRKKHQSKDVPIDNEPNRTATPSQRSENVP
jgi:hypothetical protein